MRGQAGAPAGPRTPRGEAGPDHGYPHQRVLSRQEQREIVDSPAYHGGVLDAGAAHLHPLNYALGLRALRRGRCPHPRAVPRDGLFGGLVRSSVRTGRGEVRATHLVLGCNGYLGSLEPRIADRIMPINNFILATAPLDASGRSHRRPRVRPRHPVRRQLLPDVPGRAWLILGGGENYTRRFPADLKGFVRRQMLRIFPQLAPVPIDYALGAPGDHHEPAAPPRAACT
ncbi:MAG: FAD-binding oxidoreductase [Rhodopseudomonas palustris]|nr:FAD-binding oxidoreductase [Rhodopseudomonas palustris]